MSMKTSKHTPGPWFLPDGDANAVLCGDPQDPQIVAMLEGDDVMFVNDERQMVANAKLIAAAPELLSALERHLDAVDYYHLAKSDTESGMDVWAARMETAKSDLRAAENGMRAAIAKATQS